MAKQGLPRPCQKTPETIGALVNRAFGWRGESVCRHGPRFRKAMGQAAGLGWQGKIRIWSRFKPVLYRVCFTTLSIEPDRGVDHCGSCRSCITACQQTPFRTLSIDARRCFLFNHRTFGPADVELRGLMGNRIYGCDDCLAACP